MPETKGLSLLQIREMYLGKHTKTISIHVFKDVEDKDANAKTISIPVFKDVENKDPNAKTTPIPVFKDVENKDAKPRTKADDDVDEKQHMLTSSV
jgi:hypothetical protein